MAGQEEALRSCILISIVCVLTAFGSTQPIPGFDPGVVVRQVHATRGISAPPAGAQAAAGDRFLDNGEFLLDTSSTLVPAPGSQTYPATAFDGSNFLVVWADCRNGTYTDICGARVNPDGTVLDPSGFVISLAAYDQRYPAVAFDGTNFFVVWDDYRRGHAYDIYGARVTPAGTVLDPAGIIITQATCDQLRPTIGFDGANYLVAWQDCYYSVQAPDICGRRVTPGGVVLDSANLIISQAPGIQVSPALGFDGANFLVTWQDGRDSIYAHIFGARVTPAGVVLDSGGIMISQVLGTQGDPALGFDGTNFLVAWTDIRGSFPPELSIYGTRVTPEGTVLDPTGIAIAQASGVQMIPAVGFDGTNFLTVWEDFRDGGADIYGARVAPDGTLLDGSGITIGQAPDRQGAPAMGFDGTNSLVVWQDRRNDPGAPDIYGARVTSGGAVLDSAGIVIAQAARAQSNPALGFDGANFLVVWEDYRSGIYSDIYGARVTPGGTVLDPTGIAITQAGNDQWFPALGYDGTNFLVVWQDSRGGLDNLDIYGARVTSGGAVLDPSGIAIAQAAGNQLAPALDFDGTNFLVVWEDQRGGGLPDIFGARVSPDGTVLDPSGLAIAQAPDRQTASALTFNGTGYLVVWQDYRAVDGYADIYGARVAPDGTVLDPSGFVISQATSNQYAPVLDHGGANSLVVWEDYRTNIHPDIYGARVSPDGTVLDTAGFVVSRAPKGQYAPALAYDGTRFLVVWEDQQSGNNPDIYGAWVVPGDTIYDEGSVVRQEGIQCCLALARGTGSQLFLVYQGWAGTIGSKTYNTDRIWGAMNPAPGGGVEETPSADAGETHGLPTVVRGMLFIPEAPGGETRSRSLIDTAGRKVLDLHPGPNDVRSLAPGVYLVREGQGGDGPSGRTRKVVIQR